MKPIRTVLFAEKPIGEYVFDRLLKDKDFELVAIVTNSTTDNWWATNSIWREACAMQGVIVFPSEQRLSESQIAKISNTDFEVLISVQYRWKISANLISRTKHNCNLHMSPLPHYRGFNPFFHAIMDESKFFGVTLHEIAEELDGGPIIFQELFLIDSGETAFGLYIKSLEISKSLLSKFLMHLKNHIPYTTLPQVSGGEFHSKYELRQFIEKNGDIDAKLLERALYFPPIIEYQRKLAN